MFIYYQEDVAKVLQLELEDMVLCIPIEDTERRLLTKCFQKIFSIGKILFFLDKNWIILWNLCIMGRKTLVDSPLASTIFIIIVFLSHFVPFIRGSVEMNNSISLIIYF